MSKISIEIGALAARGIEVLPRGPSGRVMMPRHSVIEAPGSLKWTAFEHSVELGAYSYQVSGYCFAARIGRYCSFGEDVQIGRQNHPMTWASTSPAFYLGDRMFDLGSDFRDAEGYHGASFKPSRPSTVAKVTTIGNDVWIGHGAYVAAGVTVGDGAVIGARSVVTKDVPAYAVVAGNPAVIRRFRLSPPAIAALMRSAWWRFAPWQLAHLDPARPGEFAAGVMAMRDVVPFQPDVIDLRTWGDGDPGA
jgi:chloramphenicol O-acetyltransferase type B